MGLVSDVGLTKQAIDDDPHQWKAWHQPDQLQHQLPLQGREPIAVNLAARHIKKEGLLIFSKPSLLRKASTSTANAGEAACLDA
jgi:hypothetical protein